MIVIPALDLRGGVCVQAGRDSSGLRLAAATSDAHEVARAWGRIGFGRLHVMDLDAAAGTGSSASTIEEIVRDESAEVQVGGGVSSTELVQRFFDAGVRRVVVGVRAIEEPEWLVGLADLFPGIIIVATDVRERRIVTRGWVRTVPLDIVDIVERLNDVPLGGVLVAALHVAGTLAGADLSLIDDVARACEHPVIAAGGVATLNDLRALEHRGVSGTIVSSALYAGSLDPGAVAQEFSE